MARAAVGLPCSAGACGRGAPSWCGRGAGRGGWWRGRAVPSRRRGRGERERRGEGAGQARGRGGRREKREGEKRKEKEENGKKKRKRKRRGKRREKGERERGIRAGITAPIAEPVVHAWRLGARERDARVEKNRVLDTGVGSLGDREIWRNREDSGNWG